MAFEYGLYIPRDTFIHKLDPRAKLIWFLMVFIASIICQFDGRISFPIYLSLLLMVALSKLPWSRIWLVTINTFVFLITCLLLWPPYYANHGVTLFRVPIIGWEYTDVGLLVAFGKMFLIVNPIIAILIIFCTTMPSGLVFCIHSLRLPYKAGFILTIALRFLPVAIRETRTIMEAQMSRGLELQRGNILQRLRNFAPIFIPLFVRMMKGVVELSVSLESKCFGAKRKRTFVHEFKWGRRETIYILIFGVYYTIVVSLSFIYSPIKWGW
ncbi:MAG: hypothetical protein DRJ49_03980 [Thermoprotei archaeon]|nr:MAG: hypothetical protein DRN53_04005 [Thermoprotei archaeon]RLE89138.1 MAG: hypothetical protein DRJ49_03980 [Thermoprotei archaeon]